MGLLLALKERRYFMAGKKRTDSKGRVLKTGESQRKDGRYQYQYMDVTGKRRCVYSWDLSDLRQQEKKIQRDIEDGIRNFDSKTMTLNRLFYEYMDNIGKISAERNCVLPIILVDSPHT